MTVETGLNGDGGRDAGGRFTSGNKFAAGHSANRKAAALRSALLAAIGESDVETVVKALLAKAGAGDVQAAKELFDRAIGRAVPQDILERVERVELALEELGRV